MQGLATSKDTDRGLTWSSPYTYKGPSECRVIGLGALAWVAQSVAA